MRSASVSVVEEIAPMWKIVETVSPRVASQWSSCSGAMMSRRSIFATLRHLSPVRSRSQTATSWPSAARAAARLEPMNPAPPVTSIMETDSPPAPASQQRVTQADYNQLSLTRAYKTTVYMDVSTGCAAIPRALSKE